MKKCTKCGTEHALSQFQRDARKRDGLRSHCKSCVSERYARYYAKDPDHHRRRAAEYKAKNPARARESVAAWRAKNADRVKKSHAEWSRANASRCVEHANKRRSKVLAAPHEPYSRDEIFSRWDYRCCYCNEEATALDHVTAISKGGADAAYNLVAVCKPCNSSKRDRSLAEWAATF